METPTTITTTFQLNDGNSLDITVTQYKRTDIVKMAGRVDTYTAPHLQKQFETLMEAGRYNLVFDMSEVEFLSSKGLWVLTETQKKCKRNGGSELVLACVSERIRSSFDLVGMSSYFKISPDLITALGSF